MKTELKQIIEELNEVILEKKLNILDKDLLDSAIKIYLTEKIGEQKQFYPKQPFNYSTTTNINKEIKNKFKNNYSPKDEPPTQKQIDGCKRRGITIPAGATKRELWKIMNEKEKQND